MMRHLSFIALTIAALLSCRKTVHIGPEKIGFARFTAELGNIQNELKCQRNCVILAMSSAANSTPYAVITIDLPGKQMVIWRKMEQPDRRNFSILPDQKEILASAMDSISPMTDIFNEVDMSDGSVFFGKICWTFRCSEFGIYGASYEAVKSVQFEDSTAKESALNILHLVEEIAHMADAQWPFFPKGF